MNSIRSTLLTLARLQWAIGLIGDDEYWERYEVALWLVDDFRWNEGDPRTQHDEEDAAPIEVEEHGEGVLTKVKQGTGSRVEDDEQWLEILLLGKWAFTKSDPDPYPSVPHGHYLNQNNKWPKLNPYTGRVFKSKHQEDSGKRLSKRHMKTIWTDERFKSFCRDMVVWYLEQFPHHRFPVSNPLRLPDW